MFFTHADFWSKLLMHGFDKIILRYSKRFSWNATLP